jgi:hypothetical protein
MARGQKKGAKPPEALPARGAPTEPPSGFGTIRAVGLLQRRAELSPVDFVFFLKSGFGLSTLIAEASSVFLRCTA